MAERSTTRISGLLGLAALLSTIHSVRNDYRETEPRDKYRSKPKGKRKNRTPSQRTAVRRRRTAKHSRKVNRQWRARK